MRTLLTTALLYAALAIPVDAQCTIKSAAFQSYGTGCTSVFPAVPVLAGKFDSANCRILLDVSAYGGCCNTFLRDRIFAFGVAKTNVPVPFIGKGCVLLTRLDLLAVLPVASGSTLSISLPKGIGTGTVYVQGAAHYFTTIGFRHDFQLTNGLSVTLK